MRAISLWQPHATIWLLTNAVGARPKIYETRNWGTSVRGTILVHAAKKQDGEVRNAIADPFFQKLLRDYHFPVSELAFGALIGRVDLVESTPMYDPDLPAPGLIESRCGNWSPERFAWRGEDPRLWQNPIPWRGKQGFFEVTDEALLAYDGVTCLGRMPAGGLALPEGRRRAPAAGK